MGKTTNTVAAIVIILANLFFLPLSVKAIITGGGPWGLGLIALPLTLLTNLFLLPAIFMFCKNGKENKFLLIINTIGLCWIAFLLYVFFRS